MPRTLVLWLPPAAMLGERRIPAADRPATHWTSVGDAPLLLPQLHQIPGVGEQVARPRHDFHADRRHDEALVIPLYQLQVHHVLQGLDPGTQGRLADMAGLGGAVEILVLVQSDQILELFQAGPTLHRGNPIDAIYLI